MNTLFLIFGAIILLVVIVIAINGLRNLNNFHSNMDSTFDQAYRDTQNYINRLNASKK